MNYIYLLNNLWQNVIHKEGYKHTYLVVYLSIVDSCNRFNWNDTPISIDVNLAKTKVSKKIFYEAVEWLVKNNLIEYKAGKNAYTIAHYKIVEVQKLTTTNTTIDTTAYTTTDTSTLPQVVPININKKHKTTNTKPKTSPEVQKLRGDCKQFFIAYYLKIKESEFYWQAKDSTALNALIAKIEFKVKEKNGTNYTNEDVYNGFCAVILKISDKWILDNFSLPIINSKFNEIFTQIKNGTTTTKDKYAESQFRS